MALITALLALLALPLMACGDVATVPGIGPDQAPQRLADAICPKAYECCMTNQLMDNMQAGTDVASCKANTKEAFQNQVDSIKASEKKGRVVYDGLKVQTCVEILEGASCADLNMTNHLSGVPSCSSFLEPKVALGGACAADYECVDSFCDRSAIPKGEPGDGKCKAFATTGAACGTSVPCGKDLTCDATAMTCKAAPPPGAPPANACFYSSACSYSGGDRGAASLLAIGLLLAAVARRRRHA